MKQLFLALLFSITLLEYSNNLFAQSGLTVFPSKGKEKCQQEVKEYYTYWKSKYVVASAKTKGAYYVQGENTGGTAADKGTSEGLGYGMIITALMANADTSAKRIYDGMYLFYDGHKSNINPDLMGWLIDAEETGSGKHSSATDGDLDIAYSLLLADKKWGSSGKINYKKEAIRIINAIKRANISYGMRINLGDWDNSSYSTRPSDWHLDHFDAFYRTTGDSVWIKLSNSLYDVGAQVQKNFSPQTGLLPDFVVNYKPEPAAPKFLEGPNDGNYYYNACRVPFRLAIAYAHTGNSKGKTMATPILDWFIVNFNNTPSGIRSGSTLDGKDIEGNTYQDAVFIAPLVSAATLDKKYQLFLDRGWDYIVHNKENYFSDSYNMLCQFYIAGMWEKP